MARAPRADKGEGAKITRSRSDDWINIITKLGTARDKRKGMRTVTRSLQQLETEEIWRSSDVAARVVEIIPDEALREGFKVNIRSLTKSAETPDMEEGAQNFSANRDAFPPEPGANVSPDGNDPAAGPIGLPPKPPAMLERPDGDAKDVAENVMKKHQELGTDAAFNEAWDFERAHGGGAILIGANDGQNIDRPLRLDNLKSIDFLTTLTPRELIPVSYYNDPLKAKYGQPEIYRIIPDAIGTARTPSPSFPLPFVEVHETRLLLFRGIKVSRRQLLLNRGWGDSIFVRCMEVIEDFEGGFHASATLLQDFSQAVHKKKNLDELLEADEDDLITKLLTLMDLQRSSMGAVMIDSEDDFERKPTSVSGMPELLDRWAKRLSLATGIPASLLMGDEPSGLNSTGATSLRFFYDRIKALQLKKLKPMLEYLTRLIFLAKSGPTQGKEPEVWSVAFNPLYQLNDIERADVNYKDAQADHLRIVDEVLMPAEVTKARYGGDTYGTEIAIDYDAREEQNESYNEALARMTGNEGEGNIGPTPGGAPGPSRPPKPTRTPNGPDPATGAA